MVNPSETRQILVTPQLKSMAPNLPSEVLNRALWVVFFPVLGELVTLQPKDANPGAFNSRVKTSILHFSQPLTSANLLAKKSTTFCPPKSCGNKWKHINDRYLRLKSVSRSGISSISYISCCWWFKHLANQFSIPAAFSPSTVASIIVQYLLQLGLCIMDTEVKSSFCNMEVQSNVKALAILGGGGATPKKLYSTLIHF